MAEPKQKKGKNVPTGLVEVEFLKDFGSYEEGEKVNYHSSTAKSLESKKIVKIGKTITKWIPETIKK